MYVPLETYTIFRYPIGKFQMSFLFSFFDKVLFQSEKSILIGGDS